MRRPEVGACADLKHEDGLWEDASVGYRIMGILNVTPDSFSDGGRYLDAAAAIEHGLELAAEGAEIIDVGGESTRPGSSGVSLELELERVLPVIEGLVAAGLGATISIDTSKLEVARAALDAGASFVNDVTAFRAAPAIAELVAARGAECCLVHMQGEPATMQKAPHYGDVVAEVASFLRERVEFALAAGIARERILVDPGIGFGKTVAHNLELLDRLDELVALGQPVLIGTSRKSFLGALGGGRERDRLAGTIATNVIALLRGASVFRVHDVAAVRDGLEVAAATVKRR
ncbi:MAG TPA: dihydropteroate synthase [Solirubrobacteraceae bacterium]|nr:dihydropteroate synthase [Solirubrobacteraceae bacterium]